MWQSSSAQKEKKIAEPPSKAAGKQLSLQQSLNKALLDMLLSAFLFELPSNIYGIFSHCILN